MKYKVSNRTLSPKYQLQTQLSRVTIPFNTLQWNQHNGFLFW